MITQESMMHDAGAAVDIYSKLEQDIYAKIINTLKTTKFDTVDSKNVLRWQIEQLAKMGVLNKQVIALVAKYTGESQQSITKLVHDNGFQIVNEIDATLASNCIKKLWLMMKFVTLLTLYKIKHGKTWITRLTSRYCPLITMRMAPCELIKASSSKPLWKR